eukprot:454019-Prorocentrum_minimum.AAC.2
MHRTYFMIVTESKVLPPRLHACTLSSRFDIASSYAVAPRSHIAAKGASLPHRTYGSNWSTSTRSLPWSLSTGGEAALDSSSAAKSTSRDWHTPPSVHV